MKDGLLRDDTGGGEVATTMATATPLEGLEMVDGWKPLATFARIVGVPESSARRYVAALPGFFPARVTGKIKIYPPETGEILRLASELFGQGARRAEVEAALSERFAPTMEVMTRHEPAMATTPALVDVVGRLATAMERQASALEKIADRMPVEGAGTPQAAPATRRSSPATAARTSCPDALAKVMELHGQGLGSKRIARQMNDDGWPTLSGNGRWAKGIVQKLLVEAGL